MQNLTIVPNPVDKGKYIVIIGHRRLAAAKAAGLAEVPCRVIEDMNAKEQMSMMLAENMQRNDLTVIEQAQGFQMMLNLGSTEEEIADQTGFSRSTVHKRLEIAKLDAQILQKEFDDYQISIKELSLLEKIKDPSIRNEVLSRYHGGGLGYEVNRAVEKEKYNEWLSKIKPLLKENGIKEKKGNSYFNPEYDSDYKVIKKFDIDQPAPEEFKFKIPKNDKLFWCSRDYETFYIFKKEA